MNNKELEEVGSVHLLIILITGWIANGVAMAREGVITASERKKGAKCSYPNMVMFNAVMMAILRCRGRIPGVQ